ncbi:MAG: hypothetical protein DRQ47_02515 [Gammaproteobacteria bacterium]|nr:MAG: hypothetical protein DRQ47_02515 [Gammaproteobacteria bacterium]
MTTKKLLLALPLAFSLSGCIIVDGDGDWDDHYSSSSWQSEQEKNRDNINSLVLGAKRSDVMIKMGEPNFSEAFTKDNGKSYQILFYRTHREHGDGETSKDETTALVFENDNLIGWGNDALQGVRKP